MAIITLVAILLTVNMILMHGDRLYQVYCRLYRKLKKPKFYPGEFVIINDIEYEIIYITKTQRPYTYMCLPVFMHNKINFENYYHESEIKKKTGLLKELE